MPSEKTKRFTRLLRTQRQLERGVEWRFAEVRAKRLAAEARRDDAAQAITRSQLDRTLTVTSAFAPAAVLSELAGERAAERQLVEKQAEVAECRRIEADVEAILQAMRVKTKQWEKLHENAALLDEEEALQVLQRSWDEHGIRSHSSAAAIVSSESPVREEELP